MTLTGDPRSAYTPQKIGAYATSQAQPSVDLSFLNDPNNPYYQQAFAGWAPQPTSGGGGDYSGGYAQAAPADYSQIQSAIDQALAARPILEASPEWKAYLNALGLEKNQFAADIARQEAQARAAAQFQTEGLKPQYDQQRRGITGNAESRGMSRSGQLQRGLAENRAAEGRQTTGIQQALQSAIGNLEGSLANKNVNLETQQQQQRASMLAAGYQPLDYAALGRYLASLPAGSPGL